MKEINKIIEYRGFNIILVRSYNYSGEKGWIVKLYDDVNDKSYGIVNPNQLSYENALSYGKLRIDEIRD